MNNDISMSIMSTETNRKHQLCFICRSVIHHNDDQEALYSDNDIKFQIYLNEYWDATCNKKPTKIV